MWKLNKRAKFQELGQTLCPKNSPLPPLELTPLLHGILPVSKIVLTMFSDWKSAEMVCSVLCKPHSVCIQTQAKFLEEWIALIQIFFNDYVNVMHTVCTCMQPLCIGFK